MQRPPLSNAAFQRPARAERLITMPAAQLLEDRNRAKSRRCLQQRHDFLFEDPRQRIGAAPVAWRLGLRGKLRILEQAIATGRADARLRRRKSDRIVPSVVHEQPHLMIGYVTARHTSGPPPAEKPAPYLTPRSSPAVPE